MATEQFENLSTTALDEDIDASQTSFDVVDASVLSSAGQFRINIEDELMLVTGVATNTLTVTRGIEGTTGATHTTGDVVSQVLTAGALHKRTEDDCLVDTYANLPAAGRAGRLFLPSDGCVLYRDTGSVWQPKELIFPSIGQPPAASSFTHVNNNNHVLSDEVGTLKYTSPGQSGNRIELFVLNPGAAPFELTICAVIISFNAANNADVLWGLGITESAGTDSFAIGVNPCQIATAASALGYGKVLAARWTGYTAGVTTIGGTTGNLGIYPPVLARPIWLRIGDDGADRYGEISWDGIAFYEIFSEANNTVFTGDRVGLFVNNNRSATTPFGNSYMRVIGWEQSW